MLDTRICTRNSIGVKYAVSGSRDSDNIVGWSNDTIDETLTLIEA